MVHPIPLPCEVEGSGEPTLGVFAKVSVLEGTEHTSPLMGQPEVNVYRLSRSRFRPDLSSTTKWFLNHLNVGLCLILDLTLSQEDHVRS